MSLNTQRRKLTVAKKREPIPMGTYRAELTNVTFAKSKFENVIEATGEKFNKEQLVAEFTLLSPKKLADRKLCFYANVVNDHNEPIEMTDSSKLFQLANGLAGGTLKPGDEFDPEEYVGSEMMLTVVPTEKGGSKISAIVPVPADDDDDGPDFEGTEEPLQDVSPPKKKKTSRRPKKEELSADDVPF